MTTLIRLAPPNSMIFVEDSRGGRIPDSMNQSLISATESCIAVGCQAEDDGETEIVLGYCNNVDTGELPVFDGVLQTPSRKLVVRTVLGTTLLEMPVPRAETKLRVWANDRTEPDQIAVGIV